ncbi:MAG TPA: mycothiol synthase [Acidimicrobiia bacterium]|nr:mycothiol synthase [Acidimicrobiia bacterium]
MVEPSVVEVRPDQFPEIASRVARIDEAARAADGHPALGDAVRLDLEHPSAESAGFFAGDDAYAHVARSDNADPRHWVLGLAIAPGSRAAGTRPLLVAAAVRHVAARGGGRLVLWVLGATADDDSDLAAVGLHPARDLYEMRVTLPVAGEPKWPAGVSVRTFDPATDTQAWLEVNNRAFAGHAEQGGWTASTLERRLAEPWFDPTLFLVAFDADGMVGYDWLKVHEPHDLDPRLGEIYVIGVDPRAQGSGLGRALAIAGLHAIHDRGIGTGMLFSAADNEPALKLYGALGFTVHRVDRAYESEVAPL